MLIVTDSAAPRAKQMLEKLRADPVGWRCIYLKPTADRALSPGQTRALTETFQTYMGSLPGGVFFSNNGHIWSIYKNELSPTQAFQLLNRLRAQYVDEEHNIEQIFVDDLKFKLPEVLARIEPLCGESKTTEQPTENRITVAMEQSLPDRMAAFLNEIPAEVGKQISQQRGRRKETVILAVEDDPFYSRLIEKVFTNQARVVVTHHPDQVLEEYIISSPDIVLMDIGLPEVSGHQLLKTLLQIDPEAYVVMASGNSARDDVMGAISTGAKGFITKPFSREKLIRAVNQAPTVKRNVT